MSLSSMVEWAGGSHRHHFGLLGALAIVSAVVAAVSQPCLGGGPPPNDDCADAIAIGLGDTAFTTENATTAGPSLCATSFGRDVWFRFSSSFNGTLRLTTCGDADFDTIIAVYQGCGCGSFNLVGCNDDAANCSGGGSRLTVGVEAGKCYRIRIAGFNAQSGLGVLNLAVPNASNAASANRILTGDDAGDRFGTSVSGGTINADDNADVVVGSPRHDEGMTDQGIAFAFQGPGLTTVLESIEGILGSYTGHSVASGCDLNGDGRDDLIVGAPFDASAGSSAGSVYALSGFNGDLLWSDDGEVGDRLGWSVACAGDVNDDGFDDAIVGAPYNNNVQGINAGQAYVYDGEDGSILFTLRGQTAEELFGWAVAGIGDVNNDGHDDVAVGAPRHDTAGSNAGRVSIFSGDNGSVLKRFNGDEAGDQFGYALAGRRFTAGSVTFSMFAVGAPFNDDAASNAGQVKVFLRNLTTPGANSCNAVACPFFTITGGNKADYFGSSVEVANLVGSSFGDIIVGAPRADLNGSASGAVYVFNGGNGALTHRLFGEAGNDRFGTSLALAGDVNNDGDNDLVVGAPLNDAGGADAGRAYVFFMDDGSANFVAAAAQLMEAEPLPRVNTSNPADLNADQVVDAADLVLMLAHWGPCTVEGLACRSDLDGNGVVDHADLLALLGAWR